MGGRGGMGGSRSTYRGESTRLFQERQAQAAADALLKKEKKKASSSGSGKSGGGGGGGSKGTASANTGGVTNGQGGGKSGSGGGSSTDATKPTTDINEQAPLTDEELFKLFLKSDDWRTFDQRNETAPEEVYLQRERAAFTKWVQSQAPKPGPAKPVQIQFGDDIPAAKRAEYKEKLDKMPVNIRRTLAERGTRIYFVKRAGDHPDYAETGYGEQSLGDGRTVGDISFYCPATNQIFISLNNEDDDASRNIMVHESGHSIDANWLDETHYLSWEDEDGNTQEAWVDVISQDDPNWIYMHDTYVKDNPNIIDYYRGGHNGTPEEGRSEVFAEALAVWFEGGIVGLRGFFAGITDRDDRNEAIEQILAVWRRYGIIS